MSNDREQYEAKRLAVATVDRQHDHSPDHVRVAAILAALGIHPPKEPTLGERVAERLSWDAFCVTRVSRVGLITAIDEAVAARARAGGKDER